MELNAIIEETMQNQEKDFYNKKFYFSYSSLNKLLWNPQTFYQMYVMGMRDEKLDAHLVQGKVIHCLLLEEKKFDDQFVISPANLPTGNLRTVLDRVFYHHQELASNGDPREKLDEFQDAVLDVMRDMNYFQNLKTDQQRLDKILTPDAYNYWGFLKTKGNKTLIDQETLDFCKTAVEVVRTYKSVCDLIGCNVTDFDNKEVFNEQPLQVDLPGRQFGLKGIVDNIVLDHDNKFILVNDIKTSSKDLKDFSESIEYYSYWMQAVIYCSMVGMKHADLLEKGYQLKFHFVVIDRNYQCYPFFVSENTMNSWLDKLKNVIDKADWHYTNRDYTLPYEFAKGKVIL
jgi:hypothetical protein